MKKYNLILIIVLLIICVEDAFSQQVTLDWKLINIGKVRQVITNTGWLNAVGDPSFDYTRLLNCEYPPGSGEEHITEAGPWIGAIVNGQKLVSVIRGEEGEFFASDQPWDTIWVVKRGDTVNIGDPVNPYWQNYIGVSDEDFICKYNDYGPASLKITDHDPLYLDVIQQCYSWQSYPLDQIIVINYKIISRRYDLQNIYLTNWMNGNVGDISVGGAYGLDDETYFEPDRTMAICRDLPGGADGTALGMIGQKSYFPPLNGSDSVLTFIWYNGQQQAIPHTNIERYNDMSKGLIMENQVSTGDGTKHIVSLGPYSLAVNDTLEFSVALIIGESIDDLNQKEDILNIVKAKDFKVPSAPPSPPLRITTENKKVILNWKPQPGEINPENFTDPFRADTITKSFEGYRIYKSTQSQDGPWTLLAEFDLPDDDYGSNTGIQYEYTDFGLVNNVDYYYAVTSFSIPDKVIKFPALESSILKNAVNAVPGTAPPETVGDVAVVPNPYRGDIAYQSYNPPWEKPGGSRNQWMEQDRRIQFINLPARCEVTIFTLAGDIVDRLEHNDPEKGYVDWNLTSNIGQAVSSGIYLFTCEDKANGKVQVGKFVIIK
jgi:hypothetical protein